MRVNSSTSYLPHTTGVTSNKSVQAKVKPSVRDFVILCPSVADSNAFVQLMAALHFLPGRYKVSVMADTSDVSQVLERYQELRERVTIHAPTGSAVLFSKINAILYGGAVYMHDTRMPKVTLTESMEEALAVDADHNIRVRSGNSEALASAFLRIARATNA